jgi:hypothetical protein
MFGRGKGGKGFGKGGIRNHRKILPDVNIGITKPEIRKLARNGGTKKLSQFPYENDHSYREGDIKPFTDFLGIRKEDGILECGDKINITQNQISWFLTKYNDNINFKKFLNIARLSIGLDCICPDLMNILDCSTVKDLVEFIDIKQSIRYIYHDKDYSMLLMASINEQTIEFELEQFKKNYSKISFIEHKIVHVSNGWIRFPVFMKIDNLDGIIYYSNIYFKSTLAVGNMCDNYKCTWCTKCAPVIANVKQELIKFLEEKYGQMFQ